MGERLNLKEKMRNDIKGSATPRPAPPLPLSYFALPLPYASFMLNHSIALQLNSESTRRRTLNVHKGKQT